MSKNEKVPSHKALATLLPKEAIGLLTAKGVHLIEKIGAEGVREVLKEVFCGRNLRDSTEFLTRQRITALNLALVKMYISGIANNKTFVSDLPSFALGQLSGGRLARDEKWLSQWVLGLTDKASQNVLRNSATALADYKTRFVAICEQVVTGAIKSYGSLGGKITLGEQEIPIDWNTFASLLNTSGTQTIAIRGSEKSTYGKLFEKLILGSLLTMLGFKYSETHKVGDKCFWLSSRENKRESDATLIYEKGFGIRFDIGFIGRGNSEITLDKVSRFERHAEMAAQKYFMATIIIVDSIGKTSRVEKLAREIEGDIVQMSASYWVKDVARLIKKVAPTFNHAILRLPDSEIEKYFITSLAKIDVLQFLKAAVEDLVEEDEDD